MTCECRRVASKWLMKCGIGLVLYVLHVFALFLLVFGNSTLRVHRSPSENGIGFTIRLLETKTEPCYQPLINDLHKALT